MAHLFNPLYVAVDGNGLAMAGAKLYFYTTGSSTPQNTYSDSSLTAPFVNANPVVANANGLFGPIYMPLTSDYKIILKDSADVTVATRDPYSPNAASFSTGGSNGQVPMINTSNVTSGFDWVSGLRGAIGGLGTSNNASDATNDIDIAAGGCMDSTGVGWINIAATTKQLDGAWAADNGASPTGMRDTGAISNATWHLFAIRTAASPTGAILASLSATAPTMPTGYTLFRRIASIVRTGGAIKAYIQDGDLFQWTAGPVAGDIAAVNPGTSAVTRVLTVPTGVKVVAHLLVGIITTSGGGQTYVYLSDLATTDVAASQTFSMITGAESAAGFVLAPSGVVDVRTDTAASIRTRISFSDANVQLTGQTLGWRDTRGKDA